MVQRASAPRRDPIGGLLVITDEMEKIVSVRAGRVYRGGLHYSLTSDDIKQAAREQLLRDVAVGKFDAIEDPLHRRNLIVARVEGAMRDLNRNASGRTNKVFFVALDSTQEGAAPDNPERSAQVRQVLDKIMRKAKPRVAETMRRIAMGEDMQDIAEHFGVTPSRVSQFREEARELVKDCW